MMGSTEKLSYTLYTFQPLQFNKYLVNLINRAPDLDDMRRASEIHYRWASGSGRMNNFSFQNQSSHACVKFACGGL